MAIDFSRPNHSPAPIGNQTASSLGTPTKSSTDHSVSAAPRDSVQLSADAKLLQSVSNSLANTPAIDEERVQQLRQAVAEGQYSIDSLQLADKMMHFETQF